MRPLNAPQGRTEFICGHTRGSLGHAVAALCHKAPFTVVLTQGKELERVAAEVELWGKVLGTQAKILALPTLHVQEEDDEALMLQHAEQKVELLGVLGDLTSTTQPVILLGDVESLCQPIPPKAALGAVVLRRGEKRNMESLKKILAEQLGYDHEALCENPGQFAVRGGIVDVYPVNAEAPVRVDFWGDEIESLKQFDPTTQRSEETLEVAAIAPARVATDWKSGALAAYLPAKVQWVMLEPKELERAHPEQFGTPENLKLPQGHFGHFVARADDRWVGLASFDTESDFMGPATQTVSVETPAKYRPIPPAGLIGDERAAAEDGMLKKFVATVKERTPQTYVFHRGALADKAKNILKPLAPTLVEGGIVEGFILKRGDGVPLMALSTADLPPYASVHTISRSKRRVARRSAVNELLDFSQVAEGDYLVHLEHGICRYRGIGKLDDAGEEVLSLEFDEGMLLHLRFSEAHLISRYVGLSKKKPKLNRLGSASWGKAKSAAQKATMDYAAELLRLQAVRMAQPGFPFAVDGALQTQFEATFPFRITPDQAKAINATKADMEAARPMDRLLCGDVGFGKTEVALRAAFKAVAGGKQVLVLCPTTILSEQHFHTFHERGSPFGVVVECLNRFRSHKNQNSILHALAQKRVDIIVGTHRLLSRDVVFKDLGLIIIDEEHRFGVEQKEQLKRLRTSVDVFAMSATPIPRTLQMALGGARDLSLIETAPQNRRPIETVVKTFDEKILKEAVSYEIERGGQVFYLHNRVRTISRVALRLQELFPTLRIAVGHGQMPEEELERVMVDFIAGRYDMLVCTTIIESGLDIPNCNTMIIEGADQFGLAQLYQLRGRVGRFNRQAYAYLFLHKNKDVASDAKARLEALRQHNELGAGFKIALRDLELRGSGNLLGPQQSGHVAGVGFELYCQLLKESVVKLKNSGKPYVPRATVRIDFDIDTRVPADYLPEPRLRLELHRELALCDSPAALKELRESLEDRFGNVPPSVEMLLYITGIRIAAQLKGIASVATEGERILLQAANAGPNDYIKQGSLFPRLPAGTPKQRLAILNGIINSL